MFIGHYGIGFAAKRIGQKASLGTLFMASQFIDLIWPIFLLLGIERVEIDPGNTAFTPLDFVYYPFTHSLIGVLFWAVLFGVVYYSIRKNMRGSILLGGLVLSHWLLDLLTHRPDLALMPGSGYKMGLGLWNSVILSIAVEALIFVGGAFVYLKTTRSINRRGKYNFWGLFLFLTVAYILNIFGPPPESTGPIALVGLFQWLLVVWAYWIDRNRTIRKIESGEFTPGR